MFTLISANWIPSSCMIYIYIHICCRNSLPSLGILLAFFSSWSCRDVMPISPGHKTVSRKYFQHPFWKISPHFVTQSNCVVVGTLSATLTQKNLGFISPPPKWVLDSFPGSGSSLWLRVSHCDSECPILTRDPCRTPWVWVPLPMGCWVSRQARPGAEIQLCRRSSPAGRRLKASAHFATWLLTHHGWKLGMLSFFFDFAIYNEPTWHLQEKSLANPREKKKTCFPFTCAASNLALLL